MWATHLIEALQDGRQVTYRPRGHSMTPLIHSGDTVTLSPACRAYYYYEPRIGDIVLARVRGRVYLHMVKARQGKRYLIGNNHGHNNGWTSRANIYGQVTYVQRD